MIEKGPEMSGIGQDIYSQYPSVEQYLTQGTTRGISDGTRVREQFIIIEDHIHQMSFIGSMMRILLISDENIGFLDQNIGVFDENIGVSNEKIGVSDEHIIYDWGLQ